VFALLLLFCLFFVKPVFASPSVTINSAPDVVTAGTSFPVSFTVVEASSSASYYYKFFGGIDNDVYKITNSSDLSYSSSWSNFPQITLNPSSTNIFNGLAFVKADATAGTFNLKIKLALTSDTNSKYGATSPTFLIEIAPAPSFIPTPTATPTSINTPTSTKTPTPIKTPTTSKNPTITPESTLVPTSIPAEIQNQTDEISTTPTPEVLGVTTSPKKYLPLIFICLGAILLLTPLIIAKIKHDPEETS
jgi:hypothetical protein